MADSTQTIVDLETRFWKALVEKDTAKAAATIKSFNPDDSWELVTDPGD